MFRNVLVPLDGSAFGEHALPLALTVARRAGATLHLMHVHTPLAAVYLEGAAYFDESLEGDYKRHQEDYLAHVVRRVKEAAPVAVTPTLAQGEVAQAIEDTAARAGADLIVMTTHGRGPLGRF